MFIPNLFGFGSTKTGAYWPKQVIQVWVIFFLLNCRPLSEIIRVRVALVWPINREVKKQYSANSYSKIHSETKLDSNQHNLFSILLLLKLIWLVGLDMVQRTKKLIYKGLTTEMLSNDAFYIPLNMRKFKRISCFSFMRREINWLTTFCSIFLTLLYPLTIRLSTLIFTISYKLSKF